MSDYAGRYLPAFACQGKEKVQIQHLLTHTSGLPAYVSASELKEQFGSPCPDKLIDKICSLKALNKPGEEFRYSCLGYMTLAKIAENLLPDALERRQVERQNHPQSQIRWPDSRSRRTNKPGFS